MSSDKKPSILLPMAAGCIAGGVEATAVWPMEFIKTQLQLNAGSKLPYNGMVSGITYTVKETGRSLHRSDSCYDIISKGVRSHISSSPHYIPWDL